MAHLLSHFAKRLVTCSITRVANGRAGSQTSGSCKPTWVAGSISGEYFNGCNGGLAEGDAFAVYIELGVEDDPEAALVEGEEVQLIF